MTGFVRSVAAILVLSFFSACTEKAPKNPFAVTEGSIGDAKRLLPLLAADSASGTIAGYVFSGLIKYDKDVQLVGDLAESFEGSDDCRRVVFKLRENVTWHDGKPFTADDVIFTYQKMIDPNVATPYSGDFQRIETIRAVDPHTIEVVYREPFAPGLSSWGMGILPKHLLENEDLNTTEFNRNPIGTGPYKMKEWVTGQKIVLSAYDGYFEGKPKIEEYVYRVIPDSATMFLELQAGGVDLMGLTPTQYQRQTDTDFFKKYFDKYRYPTFAYTYMGYNLSDPKFKDRRVRRAIDLAIDRKAIIDGVLLGLGRPANQPVPPESWAYNSEIPVPNHDPEGAKRILAEAGWNDSDGDGTLDREGTPFSFVLMTNQGNAERAKIAEIIQQSLSKVGIKVEIRVVEWQAFLHQFINKRRFEAIVLGWSLSRDPDGYDIWHSSKTKEGEFNFIGFNNPEADRLLEAGRISCDQDRRTEIYRRLHELIADETPYSFLYYPDALPVIHARIKGVEPSAIGLTYNLPTQWHIPKNRAEWYP